MATTTPKAAPAPVNTAAPTLTGTPALGQTLTCSTGTWANNPTSFSYSWLRSGVPIAGQAGSTYVVQGADEGHVISCQVTAGNGGGDYTITGLPSGSYKVVFSTYSESLNYLTQYYNGKSALGEATPVPVTAPSTTGAINAELHAGGQVSGYVTDSSTHAPIEDVYVCAEEAASEPKAGGCEFTAATGEYTIKGLPSGSYTVEFETFFSSQKYLSQFYNGESVVGEANAVAVTAGTTTAGVNAELRPESQGGQIEGKVTKASGGQEIANMQVCADEYDEDGLYGGCTSTNSKGEYTLSGLAEAKYIVEFSPYECASESCKPLNYVAQYWKDQPTYEIATSVEVKANETVHGIDASMVTGGKIEGRVTAKVDGAPLSNVEVCASEGASFECAITNSNGAYVIVGRPAGSSYTLLFGPESGNYLFQSKSSVIVTPGVTAIVNEELPEGGQVTGKVTDASTHAAIEGIRVCPSSSFLQCTYTNGAGEYTIVGLSGTFEVDFYPGTEAQNYIAQIVDGVEVAPGSVKSGVNVELQAGGEISGTVTDASTHSGLTNIVVCAEEIGGVHDENCAYTTTGAPSVSATSNALTVPSDNFTQAKVPSFNSKTDDIDFFFTFPTAGTLKWSLFFKNADVGFADSLGVSLGADEPAFAEAARRKGKKAKAKKCKKTQTKHRGRCVATLVSFASGSQSVPAGTVEIEVHADSRALKALKAGHTLHVSGTFTFQSALGGPPVAHTVSTVVHLSKKASKAKKHGKGKKR